MTNEPDNKRWTWTSNAVAKNISSNETAGHLMCDGRFVLRPKTGPDGHIYIVADKDDMELIKSAPHLLRTLKINEIHHENKLAPTTLRDGGELAKGSTFHGFPVEKLSREDLIAALGLTLQCKENITHYGLNIGKPIKVDYDTWGGEG